MYFEANMKQIINVFLTVIMVALVVDAFAFVMWSLSGQVPVDGFYIGAITKNILSLIGNLF